MQSDAIFKFSTKLYCVTGAHKHLFIQWKDVDEYIIIYKSQERVLVIWPVDVFEIDMDSINRSHVSYKKLCIK